MPPTRNKNFQSESKKLSNNPVCFNHRESLSAAEVSAAGGSVVLPAVNNHTYRIAWMVIVAKGGAVAGATAVRIMGVKDGAPIVIASIAAAGLTQGAVVIPGNVNVTVLADGASFQTLDRNQPVTVDKTGGAITGATGFDLILTYVHERQ